MAPKGSGWLEKQENGLIMSEIRQAEQIFSVSEITENLRDSLERRFPFVWVRGEISNFSRSTPGHIYFCLKDTHCQLQCVWFNQRQKKARENRNIDPLTGEVYENPRPDPTAAVQNGLEIICAGPISIYGPRGQYQLMVEYVLPSGQGSLAQAFEARKQKYAALGYFNSQRKRPLPALIRNVALVASLNGAAIHDFLRLANARGCGAHIRIFPVPAQGIGAAAKISAAIATINSQNWADVIVLARGGGSLEDLWTFNEEELTEAVFNSRIPIVAGIGHEVDFTLADMTADLRVATPSHAAQILWPLRADICQSLDDLEEDLRAVFRAFLKNRENSLDTKIRALEWLSPAMKLKRFGEEWRNLQISLERRRDNFFMVKKERLENLKKAIKNSWRPQDKLSQEESRLGLLCATMAGFFRSGLARQENSLAILDNNFVEAGRNFLQARLAGLDKLECELKGLDPHAPLRRGYAILLRGDEVVRSIVGCAPGQELDAMLDDGTLRVKVEKMEKKEKQWLQD